MNHVTAHASVLAHSSRRPLSTEQSKMAKRLIPLLDRVLVEKIVAPTKSVGGIILPESAVSKVRRAPRPEHRPIVAPPIVGPPLPFCPSPTDPLFAYIDRFRRLTRLKSSRWARAGARRRMAISFPWVRPDLVPARHGFRTLRLPEPCTRRATKALTLPNPISPSCAHRCEGW